MKIEIDTSNSAFGETPWERNAEITLILLDLINHLRDCSHSKSLYDSNGNKVGYYENCTI